MSIMTQTPFLANIGTEDYPLYIHPYSVNAVYQNDDGETEVTLNDEGGNVLTGVYGTVHEVAMRLNNAVASRV